MNDPTTSPPRGSLLLGAAAFVLAGVALARAEPPAPPAADVVRARRFELVDAQGRAIAALFENGGPRLMFYDEKGRHRLALALHGGEAPGLELFTPGGSHAVQLRYLNDVATLSLHDAEGRERVSAAMPPDPAARPRLSFLRADGSVEARLPDQAGSPR